MLGIQKGSKKPNNNISESKKKELTSLSVSQTPTLKSAPPQAIALSSLLQSKEKIEALVVEAKNLGWE